MLDLLNLLTGREELLFILRLRNYILSYQNFSAEFRIKYELQMLYYFVGLTALTVGPGNSGGRIPLKVWQISSWRLLSKPF